MDGSRAARGSRYFFKNIIRTIVVNLVHLAAGHRTRVREARAYEGLTLIKTRSR
jgi:hypothetical protein